jgi:hypothetical protein
MYLVVKGGHPHLMNQANILSKILILLVRLFPPFSVVPMPRLPEGRYFKLLVG